MSHLVQQTAEWLLPALEVLAVALVLNVAAILPFTRHRGSNDRHEP